MNRFHACKSLDELKKAYRKAAMENHPDLGGSTEEMKAVNNEYTEMFEVLKKRQNARAEQGNADSAEGRTYKTSENPEDFITIIDHLLRMEGITVELCGRWLWISGDTKPHKEALKAAGCRWSCKKKMWSWHFAEDGVRYHKKSISMDEIRIKYGSTTFTAQEARTAIR